MTLAEQVNARRRGPVPMAKIVVTKKGDGKIATGEIDMETFENIWHERGDTLTVPLESALVHEEVGYAEIVDDGEVLEGDQAPVEGDYAQLDERSEAGHGR